ncbi:MAG: sulfatase/phosphatase domain-containing protein, partial [Verrucomicrobiota bacterium]
GEGMAFDACCEVILEELEAMGETENTLVLISGDHGAPGFPRGKTNCYDFGARVLFAARWPGVIQPGQVWEAPISLIDVGPTFLAAAGLPDDESMHGENLLPAMKSGDSSGLRQWALIGRETHVEKARGRQLPYPSRAIRTADYLYIVNFKADREPMGDPYGLAEGKEFSWDELANNTRLTYADVDAGPTKAYYIAHRNDPEMASYWELGFGKRPEEELYQLATDPHQVKNLAANPEHETARKELRAQLFAELESHEDPRLNGDQFDYPPYCKEGLEK